MADKLRIMLVDDHYLVRMGLASIIALEPDMIVCAEASTGEQAQALFRTHRPDVTLDGSAAAGYERDGNHSGHPRGIPRRPDRHDFDLRLRRGDLRRAPGWAPWPTW